MESIDKPQIVCINIDGRSKLVVKTTLHEVIFLELLIKIFACEMWKSIQVSILSCGFTASSQDRILRIVKAYFDRKNSPKSCWLSKATGNFP